MDALGATTAAAPQVDVLQLGPWLDAAVRAAMEPRFRLLPAWKQADPLAYAAAQGGSVRALLTYGSTLRTDEALLSRLPRLELVVNLSAGTDSLDLDALAARGIPVRTGAGANAVDVAELAMGLMLAVGRQLLQGDRQVREQAWPDRITPTAHRISGRRLGIAGMGAIGREVGRLAVAFGMQVAYFARRPADVPWHFEPELRRLALASDVLVIALPSAPATHHLVDAAVLDALGPDGILVNVGRGSIVDERALVAALQGGRLGGAGLDVFEEEPWVPASLREDHRVVLTPHRGGLTFEAFESLVRLAARHLDSHFRERVAFQQGCAE